jgi:hypothetical protein
MNFSHSADHTQFKTPNLHTSTDALMLRRASLVVAPLIASPLQAASEGLLPKLTRSFIPIVIEQSRGGERAYDIFSRSVGGLLIQQRAPAWHVLVKERYMAEDHIRP